MTLCENVVIVSHKQTHRLYAYVFCIITTVKFEKVFSFNQLLIPGKFYFRNVFKDIKKVVLDIFGSFAGFSVPRNNG